MLGAITAVYYDSMKGAPLGKSVYNLFEAVVEPFLIQPTIIYDYPDRGLAAFKGQAR